MTQAEILRQIAVAPPYALPRVLEEVEREDCALDDLKAA